MVNRIRKLIASHRLIGYVVAIVGVLAAAVADGFPPM